MNGMPERIAASAWADGASYWIELLPGERSPNEYIRANVYNTLDKALEQASVILRVVKVGDHEEIWAGKTPLCSVDWRYAELAACLKAKEPQ